MNISDLSKMIFTFLRDGVIQELQHRLIEVEDDLRACGCETGSAVLLRSKGKIYPRVHYSRVVFTNNTGLGIPRRPVRQGYLDPRLLSVRQDNLDIETLERDDVLHICGSNLGKLEDLLRQQNCNLCRRDQLLYFKFSLTTPINVVHVVDIEVSLISLEFEITVGQNPADNNAAQTLMTRFLETWSDTDNGAKCSQMFSFLAEGVRKCGDIEFVGFACMSIVCQFRGRCLNCFSSFTLTSAPESQREVRIVCPHCPS